MQSKLISKENGEARFEMTFTSEEVEDAKVKVYQRDKDKFQIDGFRKGKAPRSIIEKHYGDNVFADDAVQDLLNLNYGKTLKELDIEVIEQPRMEFSEIKKGEDVTITMTVAVFPEVDIKDYKGVEIEEEVVEVTDADVEHELGHMQHRGARMVDVDREAKEGDYVTFDFKGFVDGKEFDGGSAENYTLVLGSGTFIPGFEDQLVGTKAGEDKTVEVTFPEKYQAEDLAGKDAKFECKIKEVKEEELPELDDEFAKDVSEFDTLDELKADLRKNIEENRKEAAEDMMKDDAVNKVVEINEFDVPASMVESELNQMLGEYDQKFQQQGLSLEGYFKAMKQTEAEFRDHIRKDAIARTKARVAVRSIAEQEGIEVTDDDMQAEIEKMAEKFGFEVKQVEDMMDEDSRDYIMADLKIRKTIDLIYDNAKKVPKKEDKKEEEEK